MLIFEEQKVEDFREEEAVEQKTSATVIDPAFTRKSQSKQIELLLGALRRERERSSELQTKFDFLMRDFKTKVEKNA